MLAKIPIPIICTFLIGATPSLAASAEGGVDRSTLRFSPSCGAVSLDEAILGDGGFHATFAELQAFTVAAGKVGVNCQVHFEMMVPDGYRATALIIFTGRVRTSHIAESLVEATAEFSHAVLPQSSHFVPLMDNQHFLAGVEQDMKLSNFAYLLSNWTECAADAHKSMNATVSLRSYNASFVSLDDIQVSLLYRRCS